MSEFNSDNSDEQDKENLPLLRVRKPRNYGRLVLVSIDPNFYNTTLPEILLKHFKDSTELSTKESLKSHEVTTGLRTRLINWLVEVTSSFECSDNVFFLTVRLLDTFLKLTSGYTEDNFHLVGITCLFIASKFDEVSPLQFKVIHENILFKDYNEEEIRTLEAKILEVLSFRVNIQTCLDTVGCLKNRYDRDNLISGIATLILYLVQFYYDALEYTPRQQAIAAFIMAAYSTRRMNIVREILTDSELMFPEIEDLMNKFFVGIDEFEAKFPEYQNPMKFLNFKIIHQEGRPLFEFL
ncbi:unnamed protein product [Blepharisma stoltei]|uniref:Cyclin-like domain-containing protein n=1 Tax=Blepharisma stoltei TaxID=1481888 RepID=A0AAU9JCL9_9CILI|nr:unnamed protein product [Blepharisma stoltei]